MRLLVVTADESPWQSIAARLRGIIVESCPISRHAESLSSCEGVVFIDSADQTDIDRALRAAKHVLCARDLNVPSADWQSLNRFATARNVHLACVNPDRFLPSRRLIKQQIPEKLGQAGLIRIHRWESAAANNDVLPEPLLRDLDLTLWLFSNNPDTLYALNQGDASQRFVQVHLGFPGGGMALIDFDGRLPAGDGYSSLSVIGAHGAAYADDHQNRQIAFHGGWPQAVPTDEGIKQWADLLRAFADALIAGKDLMELSSDWNTIHILADAVKQSLASHRAVQLEGR